MDQPLNEVAQVPGIKAVRAIRLAAVYEISQRLLKEVARHPMKARKLDHARIGRMARDRFKRIDGQIPPEPHSAMYSSGTSTWSRKTWNVVGEHIQAYTLPHQVVFDPFSGSGVTAIEAARHHRRALCATSIRRPLGSPS